MSKSDQAMRFLGFAFASADLLFEVDEHGIIAIAIGATKKVTGVGNVTLPQSSWRVLFEPSDHGVFAALIESLSGAGRKGPVRCRLKDVPGRPPRYANVFACRLPQLAPNVSCALSLGADGGELSQTASEPGLMDRAAFEQGVGRLIAEAKQSGIDVELALVEVAGLAKAMKGLSGEDAAIAAGCVGDVLRAEAIGGTAAQLEQDQFAIVRSAPEGEDNLASRLKQAAAAVGVVIDPKTSRLPLDANAAPHTLRALRFTLDHFLKEGLGGAGDLAEVFRGGLDATLRQAQAFVETVKSRQFQLVYQPIVNLATKALDHYEALARFPGVDGPFETIRMAEELDLIESFDLAVAEKVINTLRGHGPEVKIAVNVSGRSFLRPKFIDRLLALTAGDIRLKGRLMFEITESAALANLDLAEERIQRLRRDGFQVCIDDFGAGAASLSYLRNLTVDIVKIDGQYVREIQAGGRDGAVVRHLTALCKELDVRTIAEMIESQNEADVLKGFGVDMGQGHFFGQPLTQIPSAEPVRPARRVGARESWG